MMRQYTRKKPEFQKLEDVLELCRLCLQKPSEPIPIYQSDDLFSSLALRIMVCVGLEISQEKDLPNNICKECHRQLEKYHAFRKKCEYSYQRLKSHVQAVKQKKLNDDAIKKQQELLEGQHWDDKEALMLTLDMDGKTHSYDESKVRKHNKDLTSPKRRVSEDDERRLLSLSKAETEQTKNLIDKKLENDMNGTENCAGHPASNIEDCTSDQKQSGDLAMFLSSTLSALGILTTNEDGTVALLSNSLSSVEVESGDGTEIIMELVVEDDAGDVENTILETTINESAQKAPIILTNGAPNIDEAGSMPTNLNCIIWNNVDTNLRVPAVTHLQVPPSDDDISNKPNNLVKPQIEPQKMEYLGKRLVSCGECGRGFSSRATLARHVSAVHAKKRPHVCALCGRRFAQKEVWARHLLVHQEKRPFQCDQCDKSFTQRGALASHTRLHAPPAARWLTLHQCPRCPKLFLHHSGLSRHMRVHAGRTWRCGGCDRAFSDGSALRRHTRVCTQTPAPTGNHTHALKHTPDRPIASTS